MSKLQERQRAVNVPGRTPTMPTLSKPIYWEGLERVFMFNTNTRRDSGEELWRPPDAEVPSVHLQPVNRARSYRPCFNLVKRCRMLREHLNDPATHEEPSGGSGWR